MIERQTVDGKPATVIYLTSDFQPADKQSATLIKLWFDDGDVVFLTPSKE
jgi:hypothetical protein